MTLYRTVSNICKLFLKSIRYINKSKKSLSIKGIGTKLNTTNKQLLTFKSTYLADSEGEKFDSIIKKNKLNKLEIKHLHDIIYLSYISEVNACSGSKGNIEIKNDSIILKTFPNSNEV